MLLLAPALLHGRPSCSAKRSTQFVGPVSPTGPREARPAGRNPPRCERCGRRLADNAALNRPTLSCTRPPAVSVTRRLGVNDPLEVFALLAASWAELGQGRELLLGFLHVAVF